MENKLHWLFFTIVIIIFVVLQAKGLSHIAPGDENVYFYMGKAISEGLIPYKDFFFAHPPLQIYIFSALIKIFGFNFFILKSATLLSLIISSLFLYMISLELFRNKFQDKNAYIISILALILFLFSFEVMFKATFSMGTEYSIMFLIISFYLVFKARYFLGGLIGGLAGLTRFYTLAPLFIIFIFVLIKKSEDNKRKDFFNLSMGFFTTFGVIILSFALIFGKNFIEQVFIYHFLKPKLPNQRLTVYKNVLTENWPLITSFFLYLFVKNKKRFRLFFFIIIGYLLFLLSLNVPAEFYFSIAFPFMAIIGAYSLVDLTRKINMPKYIKYILVFFMISIFLWNTTADILFLEKIGFLKFSQLDNLVNKVSSSSTNSKIFGEDSIISLLGLKTNRSIALNYFDSNEMRFTSGMTNFYLFKEELDKINLSYIILRKNRGLHQIDQFRDYVKSRCSFEREYFDLAEGSFLVYRC